jgi:hypothetical protein
MPDEDAHRAILGEIRELRDDFAEFRTELARWQGGKDQLCENRGSHLTSMSARIGKMENGKGRALTWVVAIAGAVGGAAAMLARLVWR